MDVEQTRQAFEHHYANGEQCLLPAQRKADGAYFYAKQEQAWGHWKAAIEFVLKGASSMYQMPRWPRITKDPHECKKCGAENEVSPTDFDDGEMLEADTKCTECGHIAVWRDGKYK